MSRFMFTNKLLNVAPKKNVIIADTLNTIFTFNPKDATNIKRKQKIYSSQIYHANKYVFEYERNKLFRNVLCIVEVENHEKKS